MVSPDVQRVAIADYAAARGYEVTGWLEGIDQSGSRARSAWWPRLEQAVSEVESGQYGVIVVWKFSRIARHRLRWAVAIDRVEEAGGRIESATEQFDTTTSSGRLARGMMAELQAFEAERIGEVWKEVHARRIASGRPPNGKPKWGYAYDREQKLHVPDPVTGPVLADLYRRYVAGESVYQLVRWLNAHGWRTQDDGLWSDRTLRRVMDTGFASGRFLVDGQLRQGAHEALIDDDLWQAYLDARVVRRGRPPRTERSQYLLSGMVRCARCGGAMVAGQFSDNHQPKYRCATAKEQGPLACEGGHILAATVEAYVVGYLESFKEAIENRGQAQAVRVVRPDTLQAEEDVLARQIGRTDEALTRLAVQDAESPLPPEVYRKARAELDERARQLQESLETVQRERRRSVTDPAAAAASLLAMWDRMPISVRREALRGLVHCVLVTTGESPRFLIVEPSEVRPGL